MWLELKKSEKKWLELVFLKNGYPMSFIDEFFKTLLDRLYLK